MKLTQEQETLALEVAKTLNDMKSLQWHRKIVGQYSESYIREQLKQAMAMPDHKVAVSRGALYNKAIQTNGAWH